MARALLAQRLVALFVAGWLVFNFPLLGLWARDAAIGGVPLFPLAIFLLWLALIAALAWWLERAPEDTASESHPPEPPLA